MTILPDWPRAISALASGVVCDITYSTYEAVSQATWARYNLGTVDRWRWRRRVREMWKKVPPARPTHHHTAPSGSSRKRSRKSASGTGTTRPTQARRIPTTGKPSSRVRTVTARIAAAGRDGSRATRIEGTPRTACSTLLEPQADTPFRNRATCRRGSPDRTFGSRSWKKPGHAEACGFLAASSTWSGRSVRRVAHSSALPRTDAAPPLPRGVPRPCHARDPPWRRNG